MPCWPRNSSSSGKRSEVNCSLHESLAGSPSRISKKRSSINGERKIILKCREMVVRRQLGRESFRCNFRGHPRGIAWSARLRHYFDCCDLYQLPPDVFGPGICSGPHPEKEPRTRAFEFSIL